MSLSDIKLKREIFSLHIVQREYFAHVAQLVEHFLGKEEVTDSSSVVGSILVLFKALNERREFKL